MKTKEIIFFSVLTVCVAVVDYVLITRDRKKKYSTYMFSVSESGKNFIKEKEGLRLAPYWDVSAFSIGYGHQIQAEENNLMNGITKEDAEQIFEKDLQKFSGAVRDTLKVPITQNQFDALVSFAYNVGVYAFQNSTLVKMINRGETGEKIKEEFMRWIYADNEVNTVLKQRREYEVKLYFA